MAMLGERLEAELEERDKLISEQIRMGWGATAPRRIPANWREVRGPDKPYPASARAIISRKARERAKKKRSGKNASGAECLRKPNHKELQIT